MDRYTTAFLLGVIEQIRQSSPFLLNMFFPNTVLFDTEEIMLDKIGTSLTLAPFVSPMSSGKARKEKGYRTMVFTPAYLKPKEAVTPNRVMKRLPGEALGGTLSPDNRRLRIIADILLANSGEIDRRQEWMAAQALLTGTVTVEGDDYPAQLVDYGRNASLTKTLVGGARWGEAGVSPVDDLESWSAEAESPITRVVMDPLAWNLFRDDPKLEKLLDTRRGSQSQMELGPDNGKHFSYKGRVGSDMEIWVYSGVYDNDQGVKTKYLPDYSVIFGSPAVEGTRAFGAIMSPSAGYMSMEEYPRHFILPDPEVELVETQSAPLIILGRPDAVGAATVR